MLQYQIVMSTLSQCGLGAVILSPDGNILEVNQLGDHLLHGEGTLVGKPFVEIAPTLCEDDHTLYENIAFGEYLIRCPSPVAESLPSGAQMVVFRNATGDACHDMLIGVLNQMDEAIILCDEKNRVYLLNDAAVKMESTLTTDVLGEDIASIYQMYDGHKLAIPQVTSQRIPIRNDHQRYLTRFDKEVNVVSSSYPLVQNDQLLGAFSVMQDWSTLDDLQKQCISLQQKLVAQVAEGKHGRPDAPQAVYRFKDILHSNSAMHTVVECCKQVASSDSNVMIYGETGTGKELFAQSIHNASRRKDQPFLAINCAAIPGNLLEGLLFGTEKGAYTGAEKRAGFFEEANHGTLLLDEINSMDISLQSKLLRVLQDGMIRRVGGSKEICVDVRVISNINIPPQQAIQEEKLRRDLFYRLGVVNITIPPLRDRKDDIGLLSKLFIMRYNDKMNKAIKNITPATLDRFMAYSWPGNVRELQHAIEYGMNVLPSGLSGIPPQFIPDYIVNAPIPEVAPVVAEQVSSLHATMEDLECRTICTLLREHNGNISRTAKALQMSRQKLQYRMKIHQIDVSKVLYSQ